MIFGYQSLSALTGTPANVAWGIIWAMLSHSVQSDGLGGGIQRFYSTVAMVDANRADIHYVRVPMGVMHLGADGRPFGDRDARVPGVAMRGHALIVDHLRSVAWSASVVAGLPGFPTGVQLMESAAECIEWDSSVGEWVRPAQPATTEELLAEVEEFSTEGEGGDDDASA